MKRNCEFIDLGEFEMTSPVMRVSDPCYERDVAHMAIPDISSSEIRCGLLLKDGIVLIERIIEEPRLSGINADLK